MELNKTGVCIQAMKLDDYDPSSSQTSTCVDDVFFILKKVMKRSISTCEPDVVTATVKAILKTLDSAYLQVFQQKMSVTFAGQEPGNRNAERSAEQAKVNYMVRVYFWFTIQENLIIYYLFV